MSSEAQEPIESSAPADGARDSSARFMELLTPLLPRAYAAARHLTRDPVEAEDLVQDAALKAWKGFGGFQPATNFRAWFLKILSNAFYDSYRRRRRVPETVSMHGEPDHFLYHKLAGSGARRGQVNPAEVFLRRLDAGHIAQALQALPDEFRAPAILYFVEDLSYQEIAEALDCPVGTVRSRLHRGRRRLQVELWRVAEDHGLVQPGKVEAKDASDADGPSSARSNGRLSARNGSP